jgi:hypothetical protein
VSVDLARIRSGRFLRGLVLLAFALFVLFQMDGSRQPTSGVGWRILGYQRGVAAPSQVVPIVDDAALQEAWSSMRLDGTVRGDFANTSVFWLTATGSLGCPAHFAGLDLDAARRTATAVFTWALASGCDAKKVPDSFLLAIDRDRLPAPPFQVLIQNPPGVTSPAGL